MNKISDKIKSGSRAFLVTEYKYLAIFVVIMFLLLFMLYALNPLSTNQWTDGIRYGLSFLSGAVLSAIAGWGGMLAATDANVRTTQAAEKNGLPAALRVAFTGGSVAGFTVVGLGMLGVSLAFFCLTLGYSADYSQQQKLIFAADALAGFGFGASSIALFTRVAGGIFTKAADIGTVLYFNILFYHSSCSILLFYLLLFSFLCLYIIFISLSFFLSFSLSLSLFLSSMCAPPYYLGADLVGKIEMDIPEDDHRNPAVIADNVGDNVGDVAGMSADLFESFVGSIIAAVVLANGDIGMSKVL